MLAGFGDPNEDSALELSTVAAPGDEDVDLGSLLGSPSAAPDLTVVTMDSEAPAEVPRDLDVEMDIALAEAGLSSGELPVFSASNSGASVGADETRIAFDTENPEVDDEIEDLFVELIEE